MIIRTISFEWGHKQPQGACQQSTCKSQLFWRQLFVRSQGSSIVNRYLLDVLAIQLIYAEHIHTFRIDAIHSKLTQLIAFESNSVCLFLAERNSFDINLQQFLEEQISEERKFPVDGQPPFQLLKFGVMCLLAESLLIVQDRKNQQLIWFQCISQKILVALKRAVCLDVSQVGYQFTWSWCTW